jgi:DNA-binding NtrC family response regulator
MIRTALNSFVANLATWRVRIGANTKAQGLSNQQPAMVPVTIVGLMSSADEDARLLADLGGRSGWQVVFVNTCADAKAALDQATVPVVLCDRDLLGMGWRRAVERLAAPPRQACVILLSEAVDTYLWNEVVRGGGYDVLPKPLREEGLIRLVRLARSYWNSPARTGLLSSPQLADEGRS